MSADRRAGGGVRGRVAGASLPAPPGRRAPLAMNPELNAAAASGRLCPVTLISLPAADQGAGNQRSRKPTFSREVTAPRSVLKRVLKVVGGKKPLPLSLTCPPTQPMLPCSLPQSRAGLPWAGLGDLPSLGLRAAISCLVLPPGVGDRDCRLVQRQGQGDGLAEGDPTCSTAQHSAPPPPCTAPGGEVRATWLQTLIPPPPCSVASVSPGVRESTS